MPEETPRVAVVGQIARDLVVVVDHVPGPDDTTPVRRRREMLGGKGANQAVALAQLGVPVGLVAVTGDDAIASELLGQARRDGIDVSGVVSRPGVASGLIVNIVDGDGHWHYLEDLPDPVLLSEEDVMASAALLRGADWVSVQLQQPADAVRAAVTCAREAGARVVFDGAPDPDAAALLASVDVLRADAREAEQLAAREIEDVDGALEAARELLDRGPSVVAQAADPMGNVVVWDGGHLVLPLVDTKVVDTTGAGDAFTAALIAELWRGGTPAEAARLASAAAAATVGHPGGRPELTAATLHRFLELVDDTLGSGTSE